VPEAIRCDFLTLGETLVRLSPPGMQRLDQARQFEVGIGGSELNVACLLARLVAALPGCRDFPKARLAASSMAKDVGTASTRATLNGSRLAKG